MKIKRLPKVISLLSLILISSLVLTACSSKESSSIEILIGNSYVIPENFDSTTQDLIANHPDWQDEEATVGFTSINFGDPETDPYAGANIAKVSAMVAAKEVDIMICDMDNAARLARTEMFTPVEEILSEEDMEKYQDRLLTFELVDEEGNLTGEYTPACGISITGQEAFDKIYGEQEYGVFLVSNADPVENAEKVFMDILDA